MISIQNIHLQKVNFFFRLKIDINLNSKKKKKKILIKHTDPYEKTSIQ